MSMFFEYEMGNPAAIAALGREHQEHRTAWRPGSYFNHEIIPQSALYFAGITTREEYHHQRDTWLKVEASREPLVFKSKQWDTAYARPIRDQQDAREALAVLPEYLPLTSSAARALETDEAIGRAYLLVGDLENAERYLRRATRSCAALDNPFEHTWALLNYGKLLEQKGDVGGACNLYRQVVQRWSEGTTSQAAHARMTSLKCQVSPAKGPDASKH
ncbi:hypothetical protein LVJ94_38535 [Pendulispora rubella]|uniref:Tetratricopeptide repeat protein n=2 Tax=Pendulispora rubella TaxID=2741070 RepID=A0ABZ2KVT3_9BACT